MIPDLGHFGGVRAATFVPLSCYTALSFPRGDCAMSQETVQIIAAVLAVVLIGIIIMRRKGGKKKQEDEF
jgi:hypothetical protein